MEQVALEETKRLIHEGHAAILKVGPGRDDDSATAFQQFRRGVTRADGSHELSLLQDLEQKQKVLGFLVDFAQNRRSHRRSGARGAGRLDESDVLQQLPDEPLPDTPSKPETKVSDAKPERSDSCTAAGAALSAFHELEEMHFECQVEAADALSRFAQAELLQSSALDSWRIAAQGDFEVSTYLGNLRMVDPVESAESSPEHHYRSSDEEEELQTESEPHRHGELKVRWMWQDAGRGYGGMIGAGLAKLNPTRWSQTLRVEDIIADLQEYLDGPSAHRPVRLEVRGSFGRKRIEARSVAEADGNGELVANPDEWDKIRTLDMEIHFGFGSAAVLEKYKDLTIREQLEREVKIMEGLLSRFYCTGSTLEVYRQGWSPQDNCGIEPCGEPPIYLANGFSVTAFAVSYVHKELDFSIQTRCEVNSHDLKRSQVVQCLPESLPAVFQTHPPGLTEYTVVLQVFGIVWPCHAVASVAGNAWCY
eukprot:s1005_g9.t1